MKWPEFIFIRDAKGVGSSAMRPRLLKVTHHIGEDLIAKSFEIKVAKGIGDREAVAIDEVQGEMAVIKAKDGIDGHLHIDRLMIAPFRIHIPLMDYNGFYKRIYTKEPIEVYEQIRYHIRQQ